MAEPVRLKLSGFTLVELLVALVLSGVVVTIVFQALLGQGRFARFQTAREEVQQNARSALDIISGELRAVGPGGLITAKADSIAFRAPRAWGLACQDGAAGMTQLALLFPSAVTGVFRSPAKTDDSLAVSFTPAGTPPGTRVWNFSFFPGNDVSAANAGTAAAVCDINLLPVPAAASQNPRLFAAAGGSSLPGELRRGNPVYLYDRVVYDIGTSTVSGISGNWIRRNGQPMAGPVPENTGLQLAYVDTLGVAVAAPVTSQVERDRIGRVWLKVTTNSSSELGGHRQSDIDSTWIYLRNR